MAMALSGCGNKAEQDARQTHLPDTSLAATATHGHDPPARMDLDAGALRLLSGLPTIEPDWVASIPAAPGARFLEQSTGPVVAGPHVIVGSNLIGFAALDLASGALRWQGADERAPYLPVVAGSDLWLPGACAHMAAAAPGEPLLGCVDMLDTSSLSRSARARVRFPDAGPEQDAPAAALASHRRVLGAWDGMLLWAHGSEVFTVDPQHGTITARYVLPPALTARICGALGRADELLVATCDGLASFAPHGRAGGKATLRWHVRAPRSLAVAGPIAVAASEHDRAEIIWVRAEALEALSGQGERAWLAPGRYAHALLHVLANGRVLAVALDAGIRPTVVDAASGQALSAGEPAPGIQVLAAQAGAEALVMAVRLDTSLVRDAIIAYDRDLRIAWAWLVPAPAEPRAGPVGLALVKDAALVLYDGRHVARLPLVRPGPDPGAGAPVVPAGVNRRADPRDPW